MALTPAYKIKHNTRRYGSTRKNDEPTETEIDNPNVAAIDYFMTIDPTVSKVSHIKSEAVWRNAWRVRWGEEIEMRYFQIPRVRVVYERRITEIRNRLAGKKFVGAWFYRDMENWERDFRAAINYTNGAAITSNILVPFGPIEAWMGRYVRAAPRGELTLDRQLVFYPASEDIDKMYVFGVFDDGAIFWPVAVGQGLQGNSTSVQREVPQFSQLQQVMGMLGLGGGGTWSGSAQESVLRPVSAFTALYEMSEIIKEAQDYTMSAALAGAFPLTYATAKAIPMDPIEDITDDNLATAKSLNEARTKGARDNLARFSLPRAFQIFKTLGRAMKGATGSASATIDPSSMGVGSGAALAELTQDVNATYAELAQKYGRTNPAALVREVKDFVDITPGREPKVDIDVDALKLAFEFAVCREMDVPHALYRTEVVSARTSGAPNLDLSEHTMADTIATEQAVYQRLSAWLYMMSFGQFDRKLAGVMVEEFRSLRDDDPGLPAARRALQYMERMFTSDESYATLEFELLTVRSIDSLRALVEFQNLGVVPRLLVHRNAQRLFGHTLGDHPDKHTTRIDGRLHSNFNAPMLPPVPPETKAKLATDMEKTKIQTSAQAQKRKEAGGGTESGGPKAKKAKTSKD